MARQFSSNICCSLLATRHVHASSCEYNQLFSMLIVSLWVFTSSVFKLEIVCTGGKHSNETSHGLVTSFSALRGGRNRELSSSYFTRISREWLASSGWCERTLI